MTIRVEEHLRAAPALSPRTPKAAYPTAPSEVSVRTMGRKARSQTASSKTVRNSIHPVAFELISARFCRRLQCTPSISIDNQEQKLRQHQPDKDAGHDAAASSNKSGEDVQDDGFHCRQNPRWRPVKSSVTSASRSPRPVLRKYSQVCPVTRSYICRTSNRQLRQSPSSRRSSHAGNPEHRRPSSREDDQSSAAPKRQTPRE